MKSVLQKRELSFKYISTKHMQIDSNDITTTDFIVIQKDRRCSLGKLRQGNITQVYDLLMGDWQSTSPSCRYKKTASER